MERRFPVLLVTSTSRTAEIQALFDPEDTLVVPLYSGLHGQRCRGAIVPGPPSGATERVIQSWFDWVHVVLSPRRIPGAPLLFADAATKRIYESMVPA